MQANKDNRLASTVAGGVTGQVQNIQSGIKKEEQNFDTEAQKNRLDTPEAAQKRQTVLGRFDASTYKPDETKFAVSSGLTDQYTGQKTALQKQQEDFNKEQQDQRNTIQGRYDTDASTLSNMQAKEKARTDLLTKNYRPTGVLHDNRSDYEKALINPNIVQEKGLTSSLAALKNIQAAQQLGYDTQTADYNSQITGLDKQYADMSAAEKANYMKSEGERLMAANAPTDQEITDFTKYQTGAYAGPKELGDVQSLLGKAQQTQALGDLYRSSVDRQELLRKFVGGRDYTKGQRGLDEAILGQDTTSQLNQAVRGTRGAEQTVLSANQLAGAKAQDYTNKAQQFGQKTQEMIKDRRDPISGEVDARVAAQQAGDVQRTNDVTKLQAILAGTDESTKSYGSTARMSIALQAAMDSGYLSQQDAESLVGEGGLLTRSQNLGLDSNQLLSERLKNTISQGIGRQEAATTGQKSILTAMDRLAGKVGTDVEFNRQTPQYTAGQNKFDVASLQDYIKKTEDERRKTDPQYALANPVAPTPLGLTVGGLGQIGGAAASPGGLAGLGGATYAAQYAIPAAAQAAAAYNAAGTAAMMSGGAEAAGAAGLAPGMGMTAEYGAMAIPGAENAAAQMAAQGASGAGTFGAAGTEGAMGAQGAGSAGAGTMAAYAAAALLASDLLTGQDNTADVAHGAVNSAVGVGGMTNQGTNWINKTMLKNKIGDSAAGQELLKLEDYRNKIVNQGLGEAYKEGHNWSSGLTDLTQTGKMDQALAKLSGYDAAKNLTTNTYNAANTAVNQVGKAASTALFGGKTGGWATTDYNTIDSTTGQKVKIGTYVNQPSSVILKQMQKLAGSSAAMGKGGPEIAKSIDVLYNYYKAAMDREKKK